LAAHIAHNETLRADLADARSQLNAATEAHRAAAAELTGQISELQRQLDVSRSTVRPWLPCCF
jgi:hypothetical protein